MSARIAPGRVGDIGLVNWVLCRIISAAAGAEDAHLFSTLARQRGLFRGWLFFASRMMPGGKLARRDCELVILRVAHKRACSYELDHHVRIARKIGISDETVERVFQGPSSFEGRDRALLTAVDALLEKGDLDDERWSALRAHYDEPRIIELCMLVGHYEMLAKTIATLRIERDF